MAVKNQWDQSLCKSVLRILKKTIKWYHDVFGFTVVNRSEIPEAGIKVAHLARSRIFVGSI